MFTAQASEHGISGSQAQPPGCDRPRRPELKVTGSSAPDSPLSSPRSRRSRDRSCCEDRRQVANGPCFRHDEDMPCCIGMPPPSRVLLKMLGRHSYWTSTLACLDVVMIDRTLLPDCVVFAIFCFSLLYGSYYFLLLDEQNVVPAVVSHLPWPPLPTHQAVGSEQIGIMSMNQLSGCS